MRRLAGLFAFLAVTGLGAAPADATESSAGQAARALPHFLSPNPLDGVRFPGSAVGIDPGILLQTGDVGRYPYSTVGNRGTAPAGAVVFGARWKALLILATDERGLALASPGGFGLSVLYSEGSDERTSASLRLDDQNPDGNQYNESRDTSRLRVVRFGVGYSAMLGRGRTLELGVGGGSASGGAVESESRLDEPAMELGSDDYHGGVIDGYIRTLRPDSGPQFAASYYRRDLQDGFASDLLGLDESYQQATLDAGWRLPREELDDLVFGVTADWEETESSAGSGYGLNPHRNRTVVANAFVSMEKRLNERFTLRGGVDGGYLYRRTENISFSTSDGRIYYISFSYYRNVDLPAPAVHTGLGYSWRSLIIDADVRQNLDFNALLAGVAVTHRF